MNRTTLVSYCLTITSHCPARVLYLIHLSLIFSSCPDLNFQLSLCVLLAVVAAFVVEAAPQREKRQLGGILGGLLGGGGYGINI
jgi:hypothetical protein